MPEKNIVHKSSNFVSLVKSPEGVCFEHQEKGEIIILLLRAHLITLVPGLIVTIILFVLPFILVAVFSFLSINFFTNLSGAQFILLLVFWYLLVFTYAFYKFIFWYFNVYLLTNERIIDFDFHGILHKVTSYAKLNQIQDVSPKMIGFFGTFFNYGDVFVQTAAEKPEFEFHHVAMPNVVAEEILKQVRLEEGEVPGEVK